MKTSAAEARLRHLLAQAGFDLLNPDPLLAWSVFKSFVGEPVDCSEDGVLFECGVFSFTGEPLFSLDLTRQFIIEVDGEYDHMEQLHCTFTRPPTAELTLVQRNLWAEQFDSLSEYLAAVENLPEFQICMRQPDWTCEIEQEQV